MLLKVGMLLITDNPCHNLFKVWIALSPGKFAIQEIIGSRDGTVVRALASHQCGWGSILRLDAIYGLSLFLGLFSAPSDFSPGTPLFPSPQKPTFPNSNSIQISVDE